MLSYKFPPRRKPILCSQIEKFPLREVIYCQRIKRRSEVVVRFLSFTVARLVLGSYLIKTGYSSLLMPGLRETAVDVPQNYSKFLSWRAPRSPRSSCLVMSSSLVEDLVFSTFSRWPTALLSSFSVTSSPYVAAVFHCRLPCRYCHRSLSSSVVVFRDVIAVARCYLPRSFKMADVFALTAWS